MKNKIAFAFLAYIFVFNSFAGDKWCSYRCYVGADKPASQLFNNSADRKEIYRACMRQTLRKYIDVANGDTKKYLNKKKNQLNEDIKGLSDKWGFDIEDGPNGATGIISDRVDHEKAKEIADILQSEGISLENLNDTFTEINSKLTKAINENNYTEQKKLNFKKDNLMEVVNRNKALEEVKRKQKELLETPVDIYINGLSKKESENKVGSLEETLLELGDYNNKNFNDFVDKLLDSPVSSGFKSGKSKIGSYHKKLYSQKFYPNKSDLDKSKNKSKGAFPTEFEANISLTKLDYDRDEDGKETVNKYKSAKTGSDCSKDYAKNENKGKHKVNECQLLNALFFENQMIGVKAEVSGSGLYDPKKLASLKSRKADYEKIKSYQDTYLNVRYVPTNSPNVKDQNLKEAKFFFDNISNIEKGDKYEMYNRTNAISSYLVDKVSKDFKKSGQDIGQVAGELAKADNETMIKKMTGIMGLDLNDEVSKKSHPFLQAVQYYKYNDFQKGSALQSQYYSDVNADKAYFGQKNLMQQCVDNVAKEFMVQMEDGMKRECKKRVSKYFAESNPDVVKETIKIGGDLVWSDSQWYTAVRYKSTETCSLDKYSMPINSQANLDYNVNVSLSEVIRKAAQYDMTEDYKGNNPDLGVNGGVSN